MIEDHEEQLLKIHKGIDTADESIEEIAEWIEVLEAQVEKLAGTKAAPAVAWRYRQ